MRDTITVLAAIASLCLVFWLLGYFKGHRDGKREYMGQTERRAYERQLMSEYFERFGKRL